MDSFQDRLRQVRLSKGFSKTDLAKIVGVHYTQIGRYEEKGAKPAADVLAKIANALETSADYLMNGTTENMAINTLSDKGLLNQFKLIEEMGEEDKNVVKIFLDAFITRKQLQKMVN